MTSLVDKNFFSITGSRGLDVVISIAYLIAIIVIFYYFIKDTPKDSKLTKGWRWALLIFVIVWPLLAAYLVGKKAQKVVGAVQGLQAVPGIF